MSDEASNKGGDGSFFMLQAMQQQFERMDVMFNEIRDRMDRQDATIAAWCNEGHQRNLNGRRQEMQGHVDDFGDGYENEFEDENDDAILNGDGRFVKRGGGRGRGMRRGTRWQNGFDRNIGTIKMKIPSFQ